MWSPLKITYWSSTVLFSGMMCMSATVYLTQTPMALEAYATLGYPAHVLYFNATAKVLGSVALLAPQFKLVKEWAYAGFSYLIALAILAHVAVGDGQWGFALGAAVLLAISYVSYKKRQ